MNDPFRPFKEQRKSKKLLLGVQGAEWGRRYSFGMLKGDVIGGLTIASLCIPQDIGYAKLASLDPQYGLSKSI